MLLRQASCSVAVILQNPPFPRGRRYRRVFDARVLEYSSARDARKARSTRQRARPFGPPSGRSPLKKEGRRTDGIKCVSGVEALIRLS